MELRLLVVTVVLVQYLLFQEPLQHMQVVVVVVQQIQQQLEQVEQVVVGLDQRVLLLQTELLILAVLEVGAVLFPVELDTLAAQAAQALSLSNTQ